jgi:outer membrane lipoprotein SlyB
MGSMGHNPGLTSGSPSISTSSSKATKPLWAAIGVLGVGVLALGASLIHVNNRSAEPTAMVSTSRTAAGNNTAQLAPRSSTGADGGGMITETAEGRAVVAPSKTTDSAAKPAPKTVAKQAPQRVAAAAPSTRPADVAVAANAPVVSSGLPPVAGATQQPAAQTAPAPAPVVAQAPARAVCANCGTIEAVTPVVREGKAGPVGTIAGGVLGGILGHQVGNGRGKDLATVAGAVGGVVAGRAVEKNMRKETVYSVRVHMEDGSTRTVEQASAPAVGAKVRMDGNTLRTDG